MYIPPPDKQSDPVAHASDDEDFLEGLFEDDSQPVPKDSQRDGSARSRVAAVDAAIDEELAADADDDCPGGLAMAEGPVNADGQDPQRDRPPDPVGKLGLAHIEYRLDRQSNFSIAPPRSKVPRRCQLLARTTQNLDTMEFQWLTCYG